MTHRRIAAAAVAAYLTVSVTYAVPSVAVDVKYPDTAVAATLERRLAVAVSNFTQLAYQASAPAFTVEATVAGYTADYGIDAAYSRAVAKADVTYPKPRKLAALIELAPAAEGWAEVSALPHIVRLSAEAVQAGADLSYLMPTVALIETSLGFTLEFADFVVVLDDFQNVRDLTILEGPFVDDRLTVSYSAERADSSPALDTVAVGTFKEFADVAVASDELGFGFFLVLGIGDWTSPWNGAMFNEYPLHDNNKAAIVVVTDHTRLTSFGKVLVEVVPVPDAIGPFNVGKVLQEFAPALEALAVDYVHGGFFDSVVPSDDIAFSFLIDLRLGVAPTSPWNGLAFNEDTFNANDTGDWLYTTDVLNFAFVKALAEAVTPADALQPFFIGKALADAPTALESHVVDYVMAPINDSATATEALLIGFTFTFTITETFTSPFNGAAFNRFALNESNIGDGLMPVDAVVLHPNKALADSVTPSEAFIFNFAKVLADAQALADTRLTALTKQLSDSQAVAETLNPFVLGKALTDSSAPTEALVKNVVLAGFTNAATLTDGLEIEHIVPAQVIFNSGPLNEVPFN